MLNHASLEKKIFWLILFLLPTQLGFHFWPDFSTVSGIRVDYLSPTVFLTDIFIFILFSLSFNRFFCFLRTLIKSKYILIFPILILSTIFAKSPENSVIGLFKFFELLFFGHYVFQNFSSRLAISAFIPAAIIQSTIAAIQFFIQSSLGSVFYFLGERTFNGQTPGIANVSLLGELILRPYGTLPHPNVLAGYLLLSLFFVALFKNQFSLLANLGFSSILIIAIFLSLSRLIVFLMIAFIPFLIFKRIKKESLKKEIPILAITIFLFSFFNARFLDIGFNQESFSLRISLIKDSVNIFLSSPIFGVGLKNFLVNLPLVQKEFYLQPVHNIYLLFLSEAGILGFSLVFIFFVLVIKKIKEKTIFLPIFLTLFIIGMFDHYLMTLQQGQLLSAFFLGFLFSSKH